jgi:branched-chain amino acid aminotransferase
MATGTHEYVDDPRNASILINVNGELVPREQAVISVFDSGLRARRRCLGGVARGRRRDRLPAPAPGQAVPGAKAIDMDIGLDRAALTARLFETLAANAMHDGVHIRLMVTRGIKATPYQDPRVTITPPTVVIIAEHKEPLPATVENGITLFTVHVRRGYPDVQDPALNTHSKLNCITACIQAAKAGADEALMLDPHGFVATCNSTHFFIATPDGEVWTSSGDYCLAGITRANVIELCAAQGIVVRERNFTLTDVYSAAEAFVTGTFAGLVPVNDVDGRVIGEGRRGPVVTKLQQAYQALVRERLTRPQPSGGD